MSLFSKSQTSAPSVNLDKVQHAAPGLVSLAKTAAVSLAKSNLTGQRAAVYLVLDHSGSMRRFYRDGDVQRLAEQTLGLSVNLDDDGTVPVVYFASRAEKPIQADLGNYAGIVDATHGRVDWGTTNYVAAMQQVIADYQAEPTGVPALVIFQTDGAPNNRTETEQALRDASTLPIFWAFVGFGERVEFLEKLDDLRGRAVDNASFFHASQPSSVSDAELYDGITKEFAGWLSAAARAGINAA